MCNTKEAERVREVYRDRDLSSAEAYTWLAPDIHSSIFSIDYAMSTALKQAGIVDLSKTKILDVGCGRGRWLRVLNEWGASGKNLYGIEINPERLEVARSRSPHINYAVNCTDTIPFAGIEYDVVTVKTVFSSILDSNLRKDLAKYIQSVCSASGTIIVFDFRVSSPSNRDTVGISLREIRDLFPKFTIRSKSVLLAPPLMRFLCKLSPFLAVFAEWIFPFFRTHRIYIISKDKND